MSKSGETTASGFARLEELLLMEPDIVIIQLGYNDALRGIDPGNISYKNLHKILQILRQKNIASILVRTKLPEDTKKRYRDEYNYMFKRLHEVPTSYYYDLLHGIHGRADLTLADGIHPNEQGVLTMIHNIYPYVEPLVKWRIELQKFKKENM